MLLYENTHARRHQCDKRVLSQSFTVPLREKNNLFESLVCRRLRGEAETRGVKVRSNFLAAPQLCAQTCWDLQGAVSLCFVSLLLRHNCAHRPGKFHSLSELRGSSVTHDRRPRRASAVIRSYLFRNSGGEKSK